MLKNNRQNFHHSKLPQIGDIVEVHTHPLRQGNRYAKFIVESFNLTDSADYRYSIGIHCVNIANLANRNECYTVAGHWCEVVG
jgi:hypothetical protein